MNIILIIITLILLLIYGPVLVSWLSCDIKEYFDIVGSNSYNEYEAPYVSSEILTYSTELIPTPKSELNCCLIEKKYVPSESSLFGGKFKYDYKKLQNENCDLKLFKIDSNKQVYFEGENNWTNLDCVNDSPKLGSCRNVNKECIDFVTPEFCKDYRMTWSEKTCHDSLDYEWEDKQNFVRPETTSEGTFRMF